MANGIFFYTEDFQQYDMGPHHPLKPIRIRRTYELLQDYGALSGVSVETPTPCPVDCLRTTHSEEYIHIVDRLSSGQHVPGMHRYGFGTGDNPVFPGMWEASTLYTGASRGAADAVAEGRARVAMNISGGLHHAHYDRASGFCIFNDCAVAVHRLRRAFARVAYIDLDAHHGDGVQEAFYDDPSVLTLSIHEGGYSLYPGSGFVQEVGVRQGTGFSANIPLSPHTPDEVWLWAWRECALPLLRAFDPEAVVLQLGTDPHCQDPLAHLCLTAQGWLEAVRDVVAFDRPIVALGGGGYCQTCVPRMWALAFGTLFCVELRDETPASFSYHDHIPTLTDHEEPVIAPHDVEEARRFAHHTAAEVRRLLFPHFGIKASSA